jgi:KDO2-lipid IV(A) lauroyltransferase
LQTVPLYAFLALTRLLPVRGCLAVAAAASHVFRWVTPKRAQLARENLKLALGLAADDPRVEQIVRSSYRHFCLVATELFVLPRLLGKRRADEILHVRGLEYVQDPGRGAVVATAHLGNWELLGTLGPLLGISLVSIGKRLTNLRVNEFLTRQRSRYGQRIVDKDGAFLRIAREVKRGALAGILLDVHAGRRGALIDFFGRPASTFLAPAQLARRTGVPFLPVFSVRVREPAEFEVQIGPPIAPDPQLPEDEDVYRMTAEFHRRLEQAIRQNPEQWQWFHRRWKPVGRVPDERWQERYGDRTVKPLETPIDA